MSTIMVKLWSIDLLWAVLQDPVITPRNIKLKKQMIIFGKVNILYADDLTSTDNKESVATKLINTNNIHVPYKQNTIKINNLSIYYIACHKFNTSGAVRPEHTRGLSQYKDVVLPV